MSVIIKSGSTGHLADVTPDGKLKVDGTIGPLPAGANTIGAVTVTGELPAGDNTIGSVSLTGAVPAGANTIGAVTLTGELPSGDNYIGSVWCNTWQRSTFWVSRGPSSGSAPIAPSNPAPVANIDKILLVGWHDATSTKTVKIRKIYVSALLGTAVTYLYSVYRVQAVPSGGSAVGSRPAHPYLDASELAWMYQTTTATSTVLVDGSLVDKAIPSTTSGHSECRLYEWDPLGESMPITLTPGQIDGIAITSRATTNTAPDAIITVEYTEE